MELKVFIGTFRYIQDGEIQYIVTTTRERVTQELIGKMRDYLAVYYEVVPNNWDKLREIGWDNGYYHVDIIKQVVLSEQHILKHLIRQSSGVEQ